MTLNNGTLTSTSTPSATPIGNDSQTYGTAANLATDLGRRSPPASTARTWPSPTAAPATPPLPTSAPMLSLASCPTAPACADYNVTLNNGTLTVNKYAFTYTIANDSQPTEPPPTWPPIWEPRSIPASTARTWPSPTAALATPPPPSSAATPSPVRLSNGTGLASDYTVTLNNGTFTVNKYAFTYTIANDSQTYGTAANLAIDLGTTINTGINGQNLAITYSSIGDTATAHAGTYAITGVLSSGTGLAGNYTVTLNNGTFTVNKYTFTYTIANDSQAYGTAANVDADLATTIATGINGQNLDISYSSAGDTATAHAGNYPITGTLSSGTGLASDYNVTLTNGTFTVNKYAFTYTVANDSQTYGAPRT